MADASSPAAQPAMGSPVKFNRNTITTIPARAQDVTALMPQREPEPPIETGVDLSNEIKIVFAAGRGKTGKTTLLRWLTETSLRAGHSVLLADIDPSNASFSGYFADVARPDTDNAAGVTTWLQELLEHCVTARQSAIIDLGGGDTTLRALATEMPDLAANLEAAGIAPVMFYLLGTQPEDLTPALTLASRGFMPTAQALVLNEVSVQTGQTRRTAFARLIDSPGFQRVARNSIQLWMPRLFAADAIESRQCRFYEALEGHSEPQLGIFDHARLRTWLDQMNHRFSGVASWIP